MNAIAHELSRDQIISPEVPVKDTALAVLINDPRNWPDENTELDVLMLYKEVIEKLFEDISDRERQVIEMRYGVGQDRILHLKEIGKMFNLSGERIRQIEINALKKLRNHPNVINSFGSGLDDKEVNYGLGPENTPAVLGIREEYYFKELHRHQEIEEKQSKQKSWLENIKLKQQMGQLAFVKGDLLIRPLAPEVQAFIDYYDSNAPGADPALELRRVLE